MKINELFYSVQGEGRNVGRAALFLRLPFCNLSCPWCDTHYDTFEEIPEESIIKTLDECPSRFAIITGGEPSMNKEVPRLIELLKERGFEIAMESNGQFPSPEGVDFLTISPKRWTTKTGKPGPRPPFWFDPSNRPSEVRVVLDEPMADGEVDSIYQRWRSGEFQFRDPSRPRFFLSPEWGARERTLPRVVNFVQENPQWRISLQSHKILNVR